MNKKVLVASILLFVFTSLTYIGWKAVSTKREFVVLFNDNLGLCFLVDSGYTYELNSSDFTYGGGKNSGHFVLSKESISPAMNEIEINGFKGGYQKTVNKRIYEYKLNNGYKLRDEFVNAQDMPVNLVPYKSSCKKIKNKFKKHIKIFQGV